MLNNDFMQKKYSSIIIFICIIVLQLTLGIWWGCHKGNLYWDEYYTFMGAHDVKENSGSDNYLMYNANIVFDDWVAISPIRNEFVVDGLSDNYFDSSTEYVYKNIVGTYMNKYYILLNIVENRFFANEVNVWAGILINCIAFVFSQFFLFKLCRLIGLDRSSSFATLLIYGCSVLAQSMLIFVRHYTLNIMLVVIATYFYIKCYKETIIFKNVIYLFISYFIFYFATAMNPLAYIWLGGLYISTFVILAWTKRWKTLVIYVSTLIAVGGVAIYKGFLRKFLIKTETDFVYSAKVALLNSINALGVRQLYPRIRLLVSSVVQLQFGHYMLAFGWLFLVFFVIANYIKGKVVTRKEIFCNIMVLMLAIAVYCVGAILFSLMDWERYISIMFPFISIVVIYVFYLLKDIFKTKNVWYACICFFLLFVVLASNRTDNIHYLYAEDKKINNQVNKLDIKNVYVDSWHIWTQDEAVVMNGGADQIYLRKSAEMPDFNSFPNEFIAWYYDYKGVNKFESMEAIKNVGYDMEEIGNTYLSKVVLFRR